MNQVDVVVVGSCNYDLTSYVDRFPIPGETIRGSKFLTAIGGKGCNQAVQCAKLGAKVAMVGKVGMDPHGDLILKNFDNAGVDRTSVTRSENSPTGTATVVVSEDGKNFIIVVLGANLCLTNEDVANAEKVIKGAKVLVCQLEIEVDIALEALKIAKKHGVMTILNPAPCSPNLDRKIFLNVDILCLNETEAQMLTFIEVSSLLNIPKFFETAFDLSPQLEVVILTMGENGCHFAIRSDMQVIHHLPAEKLAPVDSTGAGDSFVGALAFYVALYPSLCFFEKIHRSCAIATKSVLKPGAQTSYFDRPHLDDRLFT